MVDLLFAEQKKLDELLRVFVQLFDSLADSLPKKIGRFFEIFHVFVLPVFLWFSKCLNKVLGI